MVHIVTFEQTMGVTTLVRNYLSDYNTMIDILKDEMECHVLEILKCLEISEHNKMNARKARS